MEDCKISKEAGRMNSTLHDTSKSLYALDGHIAKMKCVNKLIVELLPKGIIRKKKALSYLYY